MFHDGPIDGVVLRPLARHEDGRGWLIELFREDELPPEHHPAMAYMSLTLPGLARGPHEHRQQTDLFAFFGPGEFRVYLWDSRPDSPTYQCQQTVAAGESSRQLVLVPPGVVHAYRNISDVPGVVFNAPDQLYRGWNRSEPVDEIRHEDVADSPYVLD